MRKNKDTIFCPFHDICPLHKEKSFPMCISLETGRCFCPNCGYENVLKKSDFNEFLDKIKNKISIIGVNIK